MFVRRGPRAVLDSGRRLLIEIWTHRPKGEFGTLSYPHPMKEVTDSGLLVWVNADNPNPEEMEWVRREFDIHPIAIEDFNSPDERARIDRYPHFYSIVLFALSLQGTGENLKPREITVYVGPSFLVSLYSEPCPEIAAAREEWRRNARGVQEQIGMALYCLLDTLADSYFPIIDVIADDVEELEDRVMKRAAPADMEKLSVLKRQLLYFRRAVAPERDVLHVLLRRELPVFPEGATIYFDDVYDHLVRVLDSLDAQRDLLASAMELHLSVTSNRLNATMQTLTSWSIILMSAALISGIYGMNFERIPELKWSFGYAYALGLMFAVCGSLMVFFRRKNWM
jgi:magnesium transporter